MCTYQCERDSCPVQQQLKVYRAYQQVCELSLTRASVDFRLIKPFSLLLPQSPKPNKWQIFKALFSIYHVTSRCDSRHDLCWYFYSRLAFLSFTVLQQNWDKQLNIDLSRRQLGNNHVTNILHKILTASRLCTETRWKKNIQDFFNSLMLVMGKLSLNI